MENKYYTPEITDIRIGYECEINESLGYKDEFSRITIGYKEEDGAYTNELSTIVNMIDDGYGIIRTPYLTAEQLEAEGWIVESHILGHYAQKDGWVLLYDNVDKVAEISEEDDTIICFSGNCPSINEFRIITKLLGI